MPSNPLAAALHGRIAAGSLNVSPVPSQPRRSHGPNSPWARDCSASIVASELQDLQLQNVTLSGPNDSERQGQEVMDNVDYP